MIARIDGLLHRLGRHLPQPCVLCGDPGGPAGLCDGCKADLPWHSATGATCCPVCALPSASAAVCGQCQRHPPAFDAVRAAFQYRFPVDGMIRRLKFHAALHIAQILGDSLTAGVRDEPRPGLLLPVPLGDQRLRARGFNQSAEVARVLSRRLAVPVSLEACIRVRDTPGQSGLSLAVRRGNLKGAFRCDQRLDGIDVAVIDDVMTSGATLDAVARELKRAGARRVMGWVVARTPSLRAGLSA